MQNQTKEANNGLKFGPVSVPSTPEEFDQLAKRPGACMESANNDVWYRGVFPDIWYGLALRLNKEYGTSFEMKEGPAKKDGTPRQVRAKSDPQHVDFIAAQQGVAATTFQKFVDEIIADGYDEVQPDGTSKHYNIAFDPSVRERTAGPAKPGKGDMELAAQFIAQGDEKLHVTLGKITQTTGTACDVAGLEGEALQSKVALYVRDYRLVLARIQAEKTKNELMADTSASEQPKKHRNK